MTTVVLNTVTRKIEVFSSARDVQARAEIADHKAAADPHPQYIADADAADIALSGDAGDLISGTVPDARMPNWTGYNLASRAALAAANVPTVVDGLKLLGHAAVGDGGGAHYKRVASEPAHDNKVQSADGAWWEETFAADVTVKIPSEFATLQDAIDRLSKQPVRQGKNIILNIESGHALTAGFTVRDGDYSQFTITSDDAEVMLDAGWTPGDHVAEGINARMPNWGILVDCGGKDTGSQALRVTTNSSLQIIDIGNGLKNAGSSGLFVHQNSCVTGDHTVLTGCGNRNVWITHRSDAWLEQGTFTGSGGDTNVYVSRGSMLYAAGGDFSSPAERGLIVRRSTVVAIPFGSSVNTKFNNCPIAGIHVSDMSTVIAHTRSGRSAEFVNCAGNGVNAIGGSKVDLRGAIFTTVAGDAITSTTGAQIIATDATMTSIAGSAINCADGMVHADGLSASGAAITVSKGGRINLGDGATYGTPSQPVNVWTSSGVILDENVSDHISFTPTFKFATEGDLSVSYARQIGRYTRIGNRIFFDYVIRFTPTYTTASGHALFDGLPFPHTNVTNLNAALSIGWLSNISHTGDMVLARIVPGATTIRLLDAVAGGSASTIGTTEMPSGTEYFFEASGSYQID
jgi:hypothetical protein